MEVDVFFTNISSKINFTHVRFSPFANAPARVAKFFMPSPDNFSQAIASADTLLDLAGVLRDAIFKVRTANVLEYSMVPVDDWKWEFDLKFTQHFYQARVKPRSTRSKRNE